MLGISFPELIVILIVLFLAVGPARMAEASFQIGKWVGKLKEMAVHVRQTHLKDLDTTSFYDAKTELNQTLRDLEPGTATKNQVHLNKDCDDSEF